MHRRSLPKAFSALMIILKAAPVSGKAAPLSGKAAPLWRAFQAGEEA
jgi:hypothetical protein